MELRRFYAQVSFKSAYLRTHYPAEFIAAVINNSGGFYSTFTYVSEAQHMGLAILLPDINESDGPTVAKASGCGYHYSAHI